MRRAASLRGLSVSDYVRTRIVPLARQDVEEAETGVLRLPRHVLPLVRIARQREPNGADAPWSGPVGRLLLVSSNCSDR